MIKIAPSMLSADFSDLKSELDSISTADMLHIDVMDGQFVPNISFGAPVIKSIRPHSKLFFDVHLMIKNPKRYIKDFVRSGADMITFHVECNDNINETIDEIRKYNIKCGIALSPDTKSEAIIPYLDKVDMILLMSVYPGFGGQKFIVEVTEKVKEVKKLIGNREILIEIDGGINEETIRISEQAGVDIAVAGTGVFAHSDRRKAIEVLRG